jgi:predicted RNA-binding protein with PIN domain
VVVPPPALRPYVEFAKLSPQALSAIARVVDGDDEFREHVAADADADEVGRAGWLWLTRPEGWRDELSAIESDHTAKTMEAREARDERSATKKLAAAQAAAAKAEGDAKSLRKELERLRADAVAERSRRDQAEALLADAERDLADARDERARVVRNLKDTEARLGERTRELKELKAQVQALEEESRDRRRQPEPAPEVDSAATTAGDPAAQADGPDLDEWRPDRSLLAGELDRARQGAAALAEGLAGLAALLGGPAAAADPADTATGETASTDAPDAVREPAPGSATSGRRTPLALPGGVYDDSVEAAAHLLRAPGVVLVVDGYNVTMTAWPELAASDQRRRLVAALADLAARTSTHVELVFDGADVDPGSVAVPAPARQLVRVRFSPADVEADDVVIDLVAQLPNSRPVVVASSDRRVRDGVRRHGANVLYAQQLADLLRR